MTLLLALDPRSFSQESRSCVKCVFHDLFKCPTIPSVKSKLYARANIFGVINSLVVLQDDQLKNDHPLVVPLPSLYIFELHWEVCDKHFPKFSGMCVVALVRNTYKYFSPILPLTILCDSAIQMVSRSLVHPILVDPKKHVVGSLESDIQ